MNKKSLILAILLVLSVFLSASAVCAEDVTVNDITLTNSTPTEVTVYTTDTNDQIQEKINGLSDGDTLTFEKGEYKDILLYVNTTSITINGNGATLYGYDNLVSNDTRIPGIILNKTNEGGYAISNPATLYIINTNNLVLKDITIVAGANSGTDKGADTARYNNCLVYNYKSTNTQIINSTFDGSTWGIYYFQSTGGLIEGNKVKNQGVTGIFNFQTPNTVIRSNTVTNAKNHGIDVRHMVGPNVQVLENKIIGAKEGIYLLHSGKHTVTGNTIINCSLSSVTCCGANNILIKDNTFQNSRIGVLLSGSAPVGGSYVGYTNITIGENEWKLDQLPFPPSFTFYVAEAKSDYSTVDTMMGTHSDSLYGETYTEYTGIEMPEIRKIDYDTILKPTETTKTVTSGMTSSEIQETINSMKDGDTLIFEENAVFEDVCIYIDKNIKVIGNNATLKGVSSVSYDYVPEIVSNKTSAGGYAIPNIAVLYVLNTTNAVISNLNIVSNYPKYTMPCAVGDNDNYRTYYSTGIYAGLSKNLVITGCSVEGASWGIFLGGRPDGDYKYGCQNATITRNTVKNQYTTGIINFASPNSIIAENTVTNAVNHGIDVRFPAGFEAKVFNNTITGSKEGIYLLHSYGHYVFNNTISNCKISSITCYGSHDEYIFNNTLTKSRVAILLGGSTENSFYNVTIGPNTFDGDKLPFPPTFAFTLAKTQDKYNDATGVMRTYSDKELVNLTADGTNASLKDVSGNAISGVPVVVEINGVNTTLTTDDDGKVTIPTSELIAGKYNATIKFNGNDNYASAETTTEVVIVQLNTTLAVSNVNTYCKSGKYILAILKDEEGNAVKGAKIGFVANNKVNYVLTDATGRAKFSTDNFEEGSYNVKVAYFGNNSYKASNQAISKVTVSKIATQLAVSTSITAKANSGKYILAILKDANGNAIKGAKIGFVANNKVNYVLTDATGRAKFSTDNFEEGSYNVKVAYFGNNSYKASNQAISKVTVSKIATQLAVSTSITAKANSGKYILAILKDTDGNAVKGAKIGFVANNKVNYVSTDATGRAKFSTDNFQVGSYNVKIAYFGNSTYVASNQGIAKVTITQ